MKIDLITADAGPIIHLASIGRLDLLLHFGSIHIPDLVVMEVVIDGKPFSDEVRAWLSAGVASGVVIVDKTETGEAVRLARLSDPSYKMKDGGERAILDWLIDSVEANDYSAMVIYENGKVPKMIGRHESELSAVVLTTRSFLHICEVEGLIPCAEDVWQELLFKFPTTNPKRGISYHGKLADEGYSK